MESFGRVLEILITIILIFLIPIQYFAIKQDMISQTYVMTQTSYFVDSVRNLGYINKEMYESYLRKLYGTNNIYEIKMTHYQFVYEAEETDYRKHYYCFYEGDILEQVYNEAGEERYDFHQGDYLMLKVQNKSKTLGTFIVEQLIGTTPSLDQIQVVYGGAIRDEGF
ncbi:hypothetical protein EDD66_105128 [Mobilisporobacter senegalensis]|uniref:Uncharacterized protein n=1 Tax=Mobilisporobacter senegalensis TaxID=1329262 RepID=A0A3N1XNC7_9FIRM|nr:hypothetical protein [Mobilisporobacter senegalensis]ROR28189.1 hypothetical protein EDD66_105128 [Mobilisporobacter senegalensis]